MEKWRRHFVHQGHASQPALSILSGTVRRFYSFPDINVCEVHHSTAFLLSLKVCFDRELREDALHLRQTGHQGTWEKSITSDLSRIRGRGQKLGGLCWADPMTAFKRHDGSTDPALTTRGPYCQDSHPHNLLILTPIQQKALWQSKNISLFDKWSFSYFLGSESAVLWLEAPENLYPCLASCLCSGWNYSRSVEAGLVQIKLDRMVLEKQIKHIKKCVWFLSREVLDRKLSSF